MFKGLVATRRCLDSVLRFAQRTSFELTVIDDASPEPALVEYLEQLRTQDRITLIHNRENRGFVRSANFGMILHPERDVCLLNSDTEVHGDWLDRLRRSAYSDAYIGTVTPFSNNATICSYPRFCQENDLLDDSDLSGLDTLFAEINVGQSVEIPTAVGFCMYITRRCLERTGYFDEPSFGRGYGEENDFCRRASDIGFRHLLCADTFVYHQGSVSFGGERAQLSQQAMATLEKRHSGYGELIAAHVAADPSRLARRRVDLARLLRSPRPRLLLVTHSLLGGTEKHVQDLAGLLESRCETLILRPGEQDCVVLEWGRRGEEFQLYFGLPAEFDNLIDLLRTLDCGRIHFHHLIGFPPLIATLPARLAVPYDYTLHDYFAICPQFNLALADGRYCGEPDESGCNACLAGRPAPWRLDIASWRAFFGALLRDADRVFAPSRDVIERFRKYLPDVDFRYLPHPEFRRVKVLVLGRLSAAKGGWQVEACARDASRRRLPLSFHVLGSADYGRSSGGEPTQVPPGLPLVFSGTYEDDTLSVLIDSIRADAIYFPAQWPETYSYTLSAALQSGLPIVAPSLGAFSERLADYPQAYLVPWDISPASANDLLLRTAGVEKTYSSCESDSLVRPSAYLKSYLVDIARRMPASPPPLSEAAVAFVAPWRIHATPPERPIGLLGRDRLLALFDDLVEPGATEILTTERVLDWKNRLLAQQSRLMHELNGEVSRHRAEIEEKLSKIDALDDLITARDAEIRRLNDELSHLQLTAAELYASSSWRITAPLRWIRVISAKASLAWWAAFPLRLVHAAIRGEKRLLFEFAVKCRNKINKIRCHIRENSPNFSRFVVEPPFHLVRRVVRPVAKQAFYKFFNNMIYEANSKPVFSKDRDRGVEFFSLPNFIPSERFGYTENSFTPKVTVIVPNYNHDRFLRKRLDSIYQQTYGNFNVILLDDFSSDSSREILNEFIETYPEITCANFNDINIGNVFLQWKKGIEFADGDIIWIAESDDFCDSNFLEMLIPFFMDEAIQLAYARSVFVGMDDRPIVFAFDDYLSELDPDKWLADYVESAHNEVITALGKKNTIPNVSSAVFRRPNNCPLFEDENWLNMKICGDWVFYLYLIRGGKIAFTNKTLNYYRFHSTNSSATTYQKSVYYKEHEIVAKTIAQLYKVPDDTLYKNKVFVERFWEQNMRDLDKAQFEKLYNVDEILSSKDNRLPNILMASYSFSTGGGEIFPIRLANELKKRGYGVTFFNFNREPVNANVRTMLFNDIPVYECTREIGNLDKFLNDYGIEIIHTHHASTEHFFATYMKSSKEKVKHVATMHGMYETLEKTHPENNLPVIVSSVDLWVYIADKNLDLFNAYKYDIRKKSIKIGNGIEPPVLHSIDRRTLDIPEHAFVLCQASRAMPEKGWQEAIKIILEARMLSGKDIHLLLLGDGLIYESLLSQQLPSYIHLLGFKYNPMDYYAMSDMGFLPSRFRGESFPLSIIECLFSGRPFIASDIGEIRNMLSTEEGMAGAIFSLDNWKIPIKEVTQIVVDFATNQEIYDKARSLTQKAASRFHISNIVTDYEKIYKNLCACK